MPVSAVVYVTDHLNYAVKSYIINWYVEFETTYSAGFTTCDKDTVHNLDCVESVHILVLISGYTTESIDIDCDENILINCFSFVKLRRRLITYTNVVFAFAILIKNVKYSPVDIN